MTSKIREQLPAYAAALFPLINIAFGKGYGYAAGLVLLAVLIALFPIGKYRISVQAKHYTYILAFYFISFLITVVYTQNSLSDLDRPSRALLAIPIFIVLLRNPPNLKLLMSSFVLGAYAIGVVGLYYYFMFPEARAFDDKFGGWWTKGYMQIQTGGMAATLSVSGLVLTLYLAKHKHILLALLALGGALFALFASLASGSRGSWLFFPVALIYIGYVNRHAVKRRTVFLSAVCSVLTVILAFQTTLVQTRIAGGAEDMQQYLSGTNKNTSLGIRLVLCSSQSSL